MPGPRGYNFWRETLQGARLTVAPMVDASELAWRLLSRRYGAELCYTPMLHAHVFVKDARYRRENLASCQEDRPLIVQFCSNDPDTFVDACRLAAPYCDAVDLNLGCPQAIARRGHYGAFLQDEWDLVRTMIERASTEVDVAITAKIRVFEDISRTVEYAKMLEQAGASMLTVHGRTRDQRGPLTGLASWPHIKAVKEAVGVPVLSNGNIQYLADVQRCLTATGADGVMSAEGNLHNPALYRGAHPPVWQMSLEYLQLATQYPCPTSYARGHVFKLLHHCLSMPENFDLRHRLSKTSTADEMMVVVKDLRERMTPYCTGDKPWTPDPGSDQARLPMPPWLCQPYVRIPPEEHLRKIQESQRRAQEKQQQQQQQEKEDDSEGSTGGEASKRPMVDDSEETDLSKKKKKKMARNPKKSFDAPSDPYDKCACKNPKGGRCVHELCRACCRVKCYTEGLDCPGHRILVKTKREKAAMYYAQQEKLKQEEMQRKEREKEEEHMMKLQMPDELQQEQQHQATEKHSTPGHTEAEEQVQVPGEALGSADDPTQPSTEENGKPVIVEVSNANELEGKTCEDKTNGYSSVYDEITKGIQENLSRYSLAQDNNTSQEKWKCNANPAI